MPVQLPGAEEFVVWSLTRFRALAVVIQVAIVLLRSHSPNLRAQANLCDALHVLSPMGDARGLMGHLARDVVREARMRDPRPSVTQGTTGNRSTASQATLPQETLAATSGRQSMAQRTTGSTATASPNKRKRQMNPKRCIALHSRCEIIDGQLPFRDCLEVGRECVPQGYVPSAAREGSLPQRTTVKKKSRSQCTKNRLPCLECMVSHNRCEIIDGQPPCKRCRASGRECVPQRNGGSTRISMPQENRGATSIQEGVDQSMTVARALTCVNCQTREARCEVIDSPPCTECRKKHRKCAFEEAPALEPLDATLLWSDISARTSLPPSPVVSHQGDFSLNDSSDTDSSESDSSDTDSSETDSSQSGSWSVKLEMSQSPAPLELFPVSANHENRAPIENAPSGVSDTTHQTEAPRTELAVTQTITSDPRPSHHDGNIAFVDSAISDLPDATEPIQAPRMDPVTMQPTASEPPSSEPGTNLAAIGNTVNGLSDAAPPTEVPCTESTAMPSTVHRPRHSDRPGSARVLQNLARRQYPPFPSQVKKFLTCGMTANSFGIGG
ncbi:hypothetical protein PENSUB_11176 [Penicillium subrubescens]|uniref:Zn(2)-C6 fungal-type domain-containing protein n=1 Tax=Penicillium subrubescens TaxID=1316194 RepID=A0A1Q5T5Z1_9EURO|nr:hypothetical protein PENSUB_11176 [Penicillium subrubescens]